MSGKLPDLWFSGGNKVGAIFEWLQIPQNIANAVMQTVGTQAQDHVSVISYISPGEWEGMLAADVLMGGPIDVGLEEQAEAGAAGGTELYKGRHAADCAGAGDGSNDHHPGAGP